jgi:DNA modification methylase
MQTINVKDIVFREDLYPRLKPNPAKIQEYSQNIDVLPPIEINQTNILIDGYHRWKAHETVGIEEIPCIIIQTVSEQELLMLAVRKNATAGQQLTQSEKKKYAIQWWNVLAEKEIIQTLSISERTFRDFTKDKRKQVEEEQNERTFDMYMRCFTHQQIADVLDVSQQTITSKIAKFTENGKFAESSNFRNFEPQIYDIWNFHKATNEVRHFGNIPPEIVDNLMYYFTNPFDVVFDPFGGGGSTIDRCIERNRRYFVSDLTPIPARNDIRQHDITSGLPDELPVPDFVFLDPPYWKQAEKRYSEKETDLGNVDLNKFLDTISDIAKMVKRKWGTNRPNGKLAIIIGAYKNDGKFVDLPFLCYERINKYLPLVRRIQVPYSTQVHGGAFVSLAKEKKEILYLTRELMIFGNE